MGLGNILGSAVESALVAKALNGKIRPKFGVMAFIGCMFIIILFLGSIAGLVYGIIVGDLEPIIMCLIGVLASIYLILITPYFQRSKNYYIEFPNNSLDGFKLFYKGKQVSIKYIIDKEGKIAFANNKSKLSCVSYANGTKISNFTKYRIINYFTKWLHDNNLLSKDVTSTFEKL